MKRLRKALWIVVVLLAAAIIVMAIGKICIEFLLPGTEVVTDYLHLESQGYHPSAPWLSLSVLIVGGIAGVAVVMSLWKMELRFITIFTIIVVALAAILGAIDLVESYVSRPDAFHIPFFDEHVIALVISYVLYRVVTRRLQPDRDVA